MYELTVKKNTQLLYSLLHLAEAYLRAMHLLN